MLNEYRSYLKPGKVYIPLTDSTAKIANVLVNVGDKVEVGQKIALKYGKNNTPIFSTVSGQVIGFEERNDRFGKIVDHIIIENDKKNTLAKSVRPLKGEVNGTQVRNKINELGLKRLDFEGISTPIKFEDAKHLFVDAVYINEPFISTDYRYIKENLDVLIEGIELLSKACSTKKVHLLVSEKMPLEVQTDVEKVIVDKNINLVKVKTSGLTGWNHLVVSKVIGKKLDTDPLNDGVVFVGISTAKAIHDAVRKGLPVISRQVTVTGDALNENSTYDVLVGTRFTDLVNDLNGYKVIEEANLVIGNLLNGINLLSDDFVISSDINSINVQEEVEEDLKSCVKCGDCNDVCPVGILPQNIMDAEIRELGHRFYDLHVEECIECGKCAYVCPSKINVLEWMRRAKRRVK